MLRKLRGLGFGWNFLIFMVLAYFVTFFINFQIFIESLSFLIGLLKKVLPVFFAVFVLMVGVNYFISPNKIAKYLGRKSGVVGWLVAIVGGIISHGPIYMWYPFLADLKEKGMRTGLIATFLYNRAIKIPLIPFMILYFSWKYFLILAFVMIFASVINGLLVEIIVGKCSSENKLVHKEKR